MQKSFLLLAGAALLASSLGVHAADDCRYSAPRNAELDAAGLKMLAVEVGSNHLVIHGEPGLARIVVHGTACASKQEWLPDLKLEAVRKGDEARVTARNDRHNIILGFFGSSYAYLKLDVRVPPSLAVKLGVGSGDAEAADLSALDARVGSGDLKVDRVAGTLRLTVGSGDAVAHDVGKLHVSSVGSGDVTVERVNGDAHAGSVGSGDLRIRDIQGDVSIGSVGSGDAQLAGVGGGATIDSIGSGDLRIRDVKGNVSVGSVSSGDVTIQRAGGNVQARSVGSGDFGVSGVDGDFSVGSVGSGDLHHRGVKGKVSVPRD